MSTDDCTPLVDGIRACFPAITRHRVSINATLVKQNETVVAMRARVIIDEKFPTFNSDKLMALVDADEMVTIDGWSAMRGSFLGKPCEIVLEMQPAVA